MPKALKRIHPVFHVGVLKPYTKPIESRRQLRRPGPLIIDKEEEWEIEAILTSNIRYKSMQYLVRYKGWGFKEDKWLKREDLDNCKSLLKKYEQSLKNSDPDKS